MTDFSKWTVAQLKDKAFELDIDIPKNTRRKADWVELLERYEKGEVHSKTFPSESENFDAKSLGATEVDSELDEGKRAVSSRDFQTLQL